jgi:DNA segregation ATPase FtsK/SpoIIIE-like protein
MMNKSYNTLIAGTIGSGKSYTEKQIIDQLLRTTDSRLVLLDPKKVELHQYAANMRTMWYADNEEDIYEVLCNVYDLMDLRFERMRAAGQTASTEDHVFVFCDEMAFLMQSRRKREYVQMMNQIVLLGRAARIHLILCTQVATQDVIPACIRDNMTNIVCLRQRDAGKYRYLLGEFPGRLPSVGKAYVLTPDMDKVEKLDVADVWDKIA